MVRSAGWDAELCAGHFGGLGGAGSTPTPTSASSGEGMTPRHSRFRAEPRDGMRELRSGVFIRVVSRGPRFRPIPP